MLNNFKILKVKNITETSFTIDAIVEGEGVSVEFKRGDLIEEPLAYEEPWVYSFESINSPDGNVYSINATYFGNPRTNLEFDEVDTDSLEQINKINENIFPMKKAIISPVGLKGNEINERMKQLMGIQSINENKSNIVVELTKIGPDGNAYAIIRENHEWYIKKASKTKNLVAEDFKYIGGLQNKKQEAYPSYAKAIKHLNLKFRSLAEAYNYDGEINVFLNDNLLSEMAMAAGFSEMKGNGFTGEGNLEGNKPMDEMYMDEAKKKNNPWAICTASVGREDKAKYEACVMDVKKKMGMDESMYEEAYMDEVEMTEAEMAIDEMIAKEELKGSQKKLDVAEPKGNLTAADFEKLRAGKKGMEEGEKMTAKEKKFAALAEPKDKITYADKIAGAKKGDVKESKLSILSALKDIDSITDGIAEGEVKKKA